jgi:hypothetical protein
MTKKILRELDEKERLKRVVIERVAIKDEERISI